MYLKLQSYKTKYRVAKHGKTSRYVEKVLGVEETDYEMLKKSETKLPYEKIYNGNMKQQIEVYNIFKENLDQRETIRSKINLPCDPHEIRSISVMDI